MCVQVRSYATEVAEKDASLAEAQARVSALEAKVRYFTRNKSI